MDDSTAKKIGSSYGRISAIAGLFIAYLIFVLMGLGNNHSLIDALLWISGTDANLWITLLSGAISMVILGHIFGQLAGKLIIVNHWNFILTGILLGSLVLITSTFLSSLIWLFLEAYTTSIIGSVLIDYIFKPVSVVFIFGLIPVVFVGIWFGWRIRIRGKRIEQSFQDQNNN